MSVSKVVQGMKLFSQKRPLIFNSIIYGSFYTGAEFAQQSYTRIFKISKPVSPARDESDRIFESNKSLIAWLQRLSKTLGLMDGETSERSEKYNWAQLKRYAIYGCFLAGPALHGCIIALNETLYKWLDSFFKGTTLRIVLVKLIADQFILSPPLVTMFFVSMSTMEGKPDIFVECKAKFIPTFATSCMYWIPMQFVNFMLVPPTLRVSFVSVAAFCWVNILCYFKSAPVIDYAESEKVH